MSESKYKCKEQHEIIYQSCDGCLRAIYHKYFELLDFVKLINRITIFSVANHHDISIEARELLQRIGEI